MAADAGGQLPCRDGEPLIGEVIAAAPDPASAVSSTDLFGGREVADHLALERLEIEGATQAEAEPP